MTKKKSRKSRRRKPRQFSKRYQSFEEWNNANRDKNSYYAKRIRGLHGQYPSDTLHRLARRSMRAVKKIPLPKRNWNVLTPKEYDQRERTAKVVSMMRRGHDIETALKEAGISLKDTLRNAGDTILRTKKGEYKVSAVDTISRGLTVYTAGKKKAIVINDSKDSSKVGHYFNAIQKLKQEGDVSALKAFKNTKITDYMGIEYKLETDPAKIVEIEEAVENPEDFKLYTGGV